MVENQPLYGRFSVFSFDGVVKSLFGRHNGERRGPEHPELTGFRLSPE
jgi:hypothetical protein